jgi:sec-independent protein translocase protein TatB
VFDVSFSELAVIAIVALVVLGPKRLPEVARAAGRWAARIRRFVEDVKRDVGSEMHRGELDELRKLRDQFTETRQILEHTASSTLAAIPDIKPAAFDPTGQQARALPDTAPLAEPPAKAGKKPARTKASTKKTTNRPSHGRAIRKRR